MNLSENSRYKYFVSRYRPRIYILECSPTTAGYKQALTTVNAVPLRPGATQDSREGGGGGKAQAPLYVTTDVLDSTHAYTVRDIRDVRDSQWSSLHAFPMS